MPGPLSLWGQPGPSLFPWVSAILRLQRERTRPHFPYTMGNAAIPSAETQCWRSTQQDRPWQEPSSMFWPSSRLGICNHLVAFWAVKYLLSHCFLPRLYQSLHSVPVSVTPCSTQRHNVFGWCDPKSLRAQALGDSLSTSSQVAKVYFYAILCWIGLDLIWFTWTMRGRRSHLEGRWEPGLLTLISRLLGIQRM